MYLSICGLRWFRMDLYTKGSGTNIRLLTPCVDSGQSVQQFLKLEFDCRELFFACFKFALSIMMDSASSGVK